MARPQGRWQQPAAPPAAREDDRVVRVAADDAPAARRPDADRDLEFELDLGRKKPAEAKAKAPIADDEKAEVVEREDEVDDVPADESPDRDGLAGGDGSDDDARDDATSDDCRDSDEDCREALGKLRSDTLATIDLDIRVGGRPGNDYPCECRLEGEAFVPRRFASTTFTWKAAGYCHKPLYFEQWNLERYGHSYGFVPDVFLSGAHFFVTLPILPYKMGVELPWECVYPLGYYRPGNCAPWTCPAFPISGRGLAVEAATITGAVFLLP